MFLGTLPTRMTRTCKPVEREENHEKGPRWSWAGNHMGNPRLYTTLAASTIYSLASAEEPLSAPNETSWNDVASNLYSLLLEFLQDQDNSPGYFQPALGVWECSDSTGDYMRTQIGSPGPNWTLVEIE
jgi:hypothetical protein